MVMLMFIIYAVGLYVKFNLQRVQKWRHCRNVYLHFYGNHSYSHSITAATLKILPIEFNKYQHLLDSVGNIVIVYAVLTSPTPNQCCLT